MHKFFKWTIGIGSLTLVAGAGAGAYFGGWMMASKKKNAEIYDNGQISSFTNHLSMDATSKFEDVAGNKPIGKQGINILNLGDSVAHGDYTWQVLNSSSDFAPHGFAVNPDAAKHPLGDTPARLGSYYGFIADALNKKGLINKDYKLNYETSVSGLRLFELLNWVRKDVYQTLSDHRGANGERTIEHPTNNLHEEFANRSKKISERIKESDLITLSIGGNDLIRSIKLFGKPFHESFDANQMAGALKDVLNGNGDIRDIFSWDMNELSNMYKEFENGLQSLFSTIHDINPNTKILMTASSSPLVHAPKVLRNLIAPIFSKIEEIARRVMGYQITENKATSMDANNMYDHPNVVVKDDPSKPNEAHKVPWLAFSAGDIVSSRNGDPEDVYKPNILDIHPGLEGQGKMAMNMLETMNDAGWFKTKITYTHDQMLDRANEVRIMHKGNTWTDVKANYPNAHKESFDKIDVNKLDPDFAYGVAQPISVTDHTYTAVRKEQKDSLSYGVTTNLVGLIDALTDRIMINRNLALKNLDFSAETTINTFKKYKDAISNIGEIASIKYEEYYDGEIAKDSDNVYKLNKLWEEEKIDWYSQQPHISYKDMKMITAYKIGTAILHKKDITFSNTWDIDGDNRFTLSDIQLGQLTPLLSEKKDKNGNIIPLMNVYDNKDNLITKGKINEVILWSDFKDLFTRAFTDVMIGRELRKPSDTNHVGFERSSADEQKHAVESSGHTWDVFSSTNHDIGAKVTKMPIGTHLIAQALKIAGQKHSSMAKLIVNNKDSLVDIIAKIPELLDFSNVNMRVIRDFMSHIVTDTTLIHEAIHMILEIFNDQKYDAFKAIASAIPTLSSISSAKDFILKIATKLTDSLAKMMDELREPTNKARLDEWAINISNLVVNMMNGNKGGIAAIVGNLLVAIKKTNTEEGKKLFGIIKTIIPIIIGLIPIK